ncbi:MAG: M28 family peptidase [Porphyromonas sp.]|nr:M28 family peptidase [Porphyromonas sp.]
MSRWILASAALVLLTAGSCQGKKNDDQEQQVSAMVEVAGIGERPFDAERAYTHIERQLGFGPRVPNTEAHKECASYLATQLRESGLEVTVQEMTLQAYDGTELEAFNIIGAYNPEASHRVMLFAHWDTRPFADHDPAPVRQREPIAGADDGASGPAVLLEIGRLLGEIGLEQLGVDIMLFDAEDYGVPAWEQYEGDSTDTWALGTQYWTKNPHQAGYNADFGILLDMVGAKGATFYREYFSQEYAGKQVTMIWQTAKALGHETFFVNQMGGAVTDDHYFVIRNMRIPAVDIINHDPDSKTDFFGHYWHTHKDDIEVIDRKTLQAVGETVWQVLLNYDTVLSVKP